MPYTINTDICEGFADCVPVCPVDCITLIDKEDDRNAKGTKWAFIDWDLCIECGACYSACPISDKGAIVDHQEEGIQKSPK